MDLDWNSPGLNHDGMTHDWLPIAEYIGPDFGFDAAQSGELGLFDNTIETTIGDLFSNNGWDAQMRGYNQHFGA